jgi:hypothetical protein
MKIELKKGGNPLTVAKNIRKLIASGETPEMASIIANEFAMKWTKKNNGR